MARATKGVLVKCDPSIKAVLIKINDEHQNAFIIEDLDEEHLLVHTHRLDELKTFLNQTIQDTVRESNDSSDTE
ncbi:nucleotide excision repair, TFIIH, subunit [Piedraia hortae CBS 480.64]|uniref:General transcription and DNA repair factor IIH subunit TFB5 n=1 Tax=Piedraia hortae CBS 480.64 TaxID=1314780 RepID=A0A6A7C2X7_9PEZI|nr:nucleotide excision repair, TFIIH, subunit [Piedraia hortae CBS 480.64]